MLPAHLTGWLVVGDDVATNGDAFALAEDDDDDGGVGASDDAIEGLVMEAEEEDADTADAAFVAEWQLAAERERERASRAQDRGSASSAASTFASAGPAQLSNPLWAFDASKRQLKETRQPVVEEEAVGIDLGTTNCAIAAVIDGKPIILTTSDGQRTSPSIVSFLASPPTAAGASAAAGAAAKGEEGEEEGPRGRRAPLLDPNSTTASVVVGEAARQQAVSNPYSTYASTKRLIGRTG